VSIRSDIVNHFNTHKGIRVDLATLCGTYGHDGLQVQQAISWLIRNEKLPKLEVVERGQVWRNGPAPREQEYQPEPRQTFAEAAGVDPHKIGTLPGQANKAQALIDEIESAKVPRTQAAYDKIMEQRRTFMAPAPSLSQVGVTKSGVVMLEDEHGDPWIARRVISTP
jgi:hypothetical protein